MAGSERPSATLKVVAWEAIEETHQDAEEGRGMECGAGPGVDLVSYTRSEEWWSVSTRTRSLSSQQSGGHQAEGDVGQPQTEDT